MTRADIPTALAWLSAPHVSAWWPPDGMAGELERGLGHPWMRYFVLELDGEPVGFLQAYDIWLEHACDHPDAAKAGPYDDQPEGTVGIDYAIGRPDLIGKGHGAAFIRLLSEHLLAQGAPRVVADPSPDHPSSAAACRRAGFRLLDERDSPDGPVLLMARDRD